MAEEELKQTNENLANEKETEKAQEKETQTAQNQSENVEEKKCDCESSTSKEETESESTSTENSSEEKELSEEEKLQEKVAQLEKENADLKDQILRRAADFDNYRKRMLKEKAETAEYANANLLSDLLDSLDNFDRTVEAGATATDVKAIVDGVKLVNESLVKMLENKYGLLSYGVAGDEFNPDLHEAIGRLEVEGAEKETLNQVYLKGYKLKEKVIRHAKVMVSVPKA